MEVIGVKSNKKEGEHCTLGLTHHKFGQSRETEPHEAKKKSFDLSGNRTHDLRIRSTVTLPTELQGRTEKAGDDYSWV